jgi:hypothetical protein
VSGPHDQFEPVEAVDPLTVVPVEVVDLIAEAARACPAVAGLHAGPFGQHTTYLPGRRVSGVRLSPEETVVGVVGCYPASVAEIVSQVRAAVGALVPGVPVTIHVEDLLLPGEQLPGDSRDPPDPTDDPGGGAPRPPPNAQAEPVIPEPTPAPVRSTGPTRSAPPPGTRPRGEPVPVRPPSAMLLAPPDRE